MSFAMTGKDVMRIYTKGRKQYSLRKQESFPMGKEETQKKNLKEKQMS